MLENNSLTEDLNRPPRPTGRGRRAFDPFFVFTYSLLALAGLIQLFVMFSMDFL